MTEREKNFTDALVKKGVAFTSVTEPTEGFLQVVTCDSKKVQSVAKEFAYTFVKEDRIGNESVVYFLTDF